MDLAFANPLWLLGVLAAVPLAAHLFSRARPRPRDFPSLRLLREAMRQVTRVRRPRDWVLLLLRTLAIVALLLAFLQPLLMSRFAAPGGPARTIVLVVDQSASMGFADGTRTRMAQAAAAAEEVLATLPAASKANIVWMRALAVSALPEPGPNLEFLRQELRQAVARPEPGDISGAIGLALEQLRAAQGARELIVLSDFQESAWRDVRWDLPSKIRTSRVSLGEGDAANLALAGLALEPTRPVAGQESRLTCRVRNFSAEPRRATVFVEAGEARATQTVEIAPWSETLAIMPVRFPSVGIVPIKAALAEDRFPGDDTRYTLAEIRGKLDVVVAGPAGDPTAAVWTRATAALDAVAVRRIEFGAGAARERADVLFVAAWDGRHGDALRERLESGGIVVLQPGEGILRGALSFPAGTERGSDAGRPAMLDARQPDTPGWRLRLVQEEHSVFSLFAGGLYGDPAGATVRRRIASMILPADAQVLLAFDDGTPALALIEPPKGGLLAFWNVDLGATNWQEQSVFVPFFGEFLGHLAARAPAPVLREAEPGEPLRFSAAAAVDPADVSLVDEKDRALEILPASRDASQELATVLPAPPGSYRWMAQGTVLDRAIVNFPESESDLRGLPLDALQAAGGGLVASSKSARIAELREGKPLWPWCLAASALFFLIEGAVLWRLPERWAAQAPSSKRETAA